MTITRKHLLRALELAGRIEVGITATDGPNGAVAHLMAEALNEAVDSMTAVITEDLWAGSDEEIVRRLRRHMADLDRYCDMIRWMAKAVAEGQDAEPQLDDEDKEDILRAIGINEAPDA